MRPLKLSRHHFTEPKTGAGLSQTSIPSDQMFIWCLCPCRPHQRHKLSLNISDAQDRLLSCCKQSILISNKPKHSACVLIYVRWQLLLPDSCWKLVAAE